MPSWFILGLLEYILTMSKKNLDFSSPPPKTVYK